MSWSTSRPAPIDKPGWTTDPTLPPRTSSQEWAVLLTLGPTNLTVECVTNLELQALKGLGVVRSVTVARNLSLLSILQIAISQQVTAARNVALQGMGVFS
ncbi:hypothetical protein ACNQR9_26095 [Mycolicibacterium peregrinum]